ncbi:MAG TPA: CAP domain-containing protein, partial [Candidatus Saccharimonadales bacterium]|nr:CAP domain-containing protein [Candidatus Saccharimonadales bacterium]
MKTYWPYLPMALIVGVGLACSSFWGSIHKDVLGYATNMSISALLQDTNTQRQGNSLAGLTLNDQLDQAAQAKANDMATRNYWSHNTPDGATPWTFIINAGYQYQTAGENLAYGFDSSDATLTAWMNSPEHKANILNNTYTDVGFGIANAPDYQGSGPETIVVAMYGSPAPSTNVSVPGTPAPTPIVSSTSPTPPSSTSPTSNTPTSTPTGNTPSSPASPTAT